MAFGKCDVCGNDAEHVWRCKEHYTCDVCGVGNGLVFRDGGVTCDPCFKDEMDKRIAEFEGETEYMSCVVCPWCGHEHGDSNEIGEGEFNCSMCENLMDVTRHVIIEYTTRKEVK